MKALEIMVGSLGRHLKTEPNSDLYLRIGLAVVTESVGPYGSGLENAEVIFLPGGSLDLCVAVERLSNSVALPYLFLYVWIFCSSVC